jgi:enolase
MLQLHIFNGKKYKTSFGIFTREKFLQYYQRLIKKYPLEGIEDPFSEDDPESWEEFTKKYSKKILIIGDDLLVTNPKRIKIAKERNLCNAAIIKINQIGTITEAIEAVKLAKSFGFKIMVSHRSGETTDDFVADFSVGVFSDFVKFGAPVRGERVVKYNRLLKIEEELKCQK